MTAERDDELLEATKMGRRSMLKRVLIGGAVAYTAPVVATFALNGAAAQGDSPDRLDFPIGGNLDWGEFPRGGNLDWPEGGLDWGDVPTGETPTATATPDPTPSVAPTAAPTAVPKKPDTKQPKSGGSTAPSFTG